MSFILYDLQFFNQPNFRLSDKTKSNLKLDDIRNVLLMLKLLGFVFILDKLFYLNMHINFT